MILRPGRDPSNLPNTSFACKWKIHEKPRSWCFGIISTMPFWAVTFSGLWSICFTYKWWPSRLLTVFILLDWILWRHTGILWLLWLLALVYWQIILQKKEKNKNLICNICPSLWCKYYHHDWFKANQDVSELEVGKIYTKVVLLSHNLQLFHCCKGGDSAITASSTVLRTRCSISRNVPLICKFDHSASI